MASKSPKKLLLSWIDDPVQYTRDVFPRARIYDHQDYILSSLATRKKVAVTSGHGIGKDATAAKAIWWFLTTRPFPKIVCTAPTAGQLEDVLWPELSKWQTRMGMPGWLADQYEVIDRVVRNKEHPREWWSKAVVPRKGEEESIQGRHEDHVMILLDEASGVDDAVIESLLGTLTSPNSYVLAIGNPTRHSGFFYDCFHKFSSIYYAIRVDGEEISQKHPELVSPDFIRLCETHGRDSDFFRVRVKGLFPKHFGRQLFSADVLNDAIGRKVAKEPFYDLVVDVARFGGDDSVIGWCRGGTVERFETHPKCDAVELAGWISNHIWDSLSRSLPIRSVLLDEPGVGSGPTDILRRTSQVPIISFNGGSTGRKFANGKRIEYRDPNGEAINKRFNNLRTYAYYRLKELLESNQISIPDDRELRHQLLNTPFDHDAAGRIIIPSKAKLRSGVRLEGVLYKLDKSPDKADVCAMAAALPSLLGAHLVNPSLATANMQNDEDSPLWDDEPEERSYGWAGIFS